MGEAAASKKDELKKMMDDLPEEEKNGEVWKYISYLLDKLVDRGCSLYEALQRVDEQCRLLKLIATIQEKLQEPECGKETILEVIDFQKKNASQTLIDSYTKSFCRNFYGNLSPDESPLDKLKEFVEQGKINPEDTKKVILDHLTRYQEDRSNELVTNMAMASAWVAALQVAKIYMAWQTISDASNLITENPNEIATINENVEEMKNMVTEFLKFCETNPKDISRISFKMEKINTLFESIRDDISELRIKIDGHVQRLDLTKTYLAIDGGGNAITAFSHGFQVWHAWANLTTYTAKVLGTLMTAVFGGLVVANFTQFCISQNTLKDLRKDLREVNRLLQMLRDLHKKAAQALRAIPD